MRVWLASPQETGAYWLRSHTSGDMLVTVALWHEKRVVMFGPEVITRFHPDDMWMKIQAPPKDRR